MGHTRMSTTWIEDVYATETESAAALDALLAQVALWNVWAEVPGVMLQPKPCQRDRTVRIDRLLIPNQRLVDQGWKHGAIGIEIKRSGIKMGPAIAQAMDYTRAVWTLPRGGVQVWLSWVFLWPMPKQGGPVASILAQNRVGTATSDHWTTLQLKSGEQNILRVHSPHSGRRGQVDIGSGTNGRRVGSR